MAVLALAATRPGVTTMSVVSAVSTVDAAVRTMVALTLLLVVVGRHVAGSGGMVVAFGVASS